MKCKYLIWMPVIRPIWQKRLKMTNLRLEAEWQAADIVTHVWKYLYECAVQAIVMLTLHTVSWNN